MNRKENEQINERHKEVWKKQSRNSVISKYHGWHSIVTNIGGDVFALAVIFQSESIYFVEENTLKTSKQKIRYKNKSEILGIRKQAESKFDVKLFEDWDAKQSKADKSEAS